MTYQHVFDLMLLILLHTSKPMASLPVFFLYHLLLFQQHYLFTIQLGLLLRIGCFNTFVKIISICLLFAFPVSVFFLLYLLVFQIFSLLPAALSFSFILQTRTYTHNTHTRSFTRCISSFAPLWQSYHSRARSLFANPCPQNNSKINQQQL